MTTRIPLLDVNVLVAVAWPNHVNHTTARAWFAKHSADGWATTAMTEAGFVRVSSNRTAMRSVASPSTALELLRRLTALPGHAFWADDIAHVVGPYVDPRRLQGYRQVTDAHLLAIAMDHNGRLATFDTGIRELIDDESAVELLDNS